MKKSIFTLLAVAAFTLIGTAVYASHSDSDRPTARQRQFQPGKYKKALNLSDDQVAKIKAEFVAQKGAMKTQALKVRDSRASLRQAIQAGAPEADIRNAAAAVGAAEGDLALVRSSLFAHIKPILTPEQLEKFQSMQARHARR